ncbi:acetylcholinesterase-1-like [Ornithodoros turicata]|uniref:acetylcholinesterase-1-like n=1 Tax=Ornithodoros turicata TaxID=34597 RepID=UPI003139E46A
MKTWLACLAVGLVGLIAISIATCILRLPPEVFARISSDVEEEPPRRGIRHSDDIVLLSVNSVNATADKEVLLVVAPEDEVDVNVRRPQQQADESLQDIRHDSSSSQSFWPSQTLPETTTRGDSMKDDSVLQTTASESGGPLVQTSTGLVEGIKMDVHGRMLDVFLGIPFAEPPIGDLRFRKPVAVRPWSGMYNASRMGPPCYQVFYSSTWDWAIPKRDYSEDCLHLNIWAPSCNQTKCPLKPVLIFIYGGGFNIGSTDWEFYDGRMLAAYGDVVMASMNYRLGPLGFLNAGNDEAPGNMGLFDQNMALKWIHTNARAFGGDPNHIVLIGESAGAVSAGMHLISPLSKHMVKRVVLQSGSPMWDTPDNTKDGPKKADELANIFHCSNDTHNFESHPKAVIRCLRDVDALTLFRTGEKVLGKRMLTYQPRLGDEFIPINPQEALKKGLFKDSSVLLGVNKDEGSIFVANSLPQIFLNDAAPNITTDEAAFYTIFFFQYLIRQGTRDIRDHYYKNLKDADFDTVRQTFYDAIGDYLQICPTKYYAEAYSKFNNSVYFYYYTHRPSNSYWAEWLGTAHFDEVEFIFGLPVRFPEQFTNQEVEFSRTMMDIWLTFSKTGKPPAVNGLTWPRFTEDNDVHLELNPKQYRIGKGLHKSHCHFWKKYIVKS